MFAVAQDEGMTPFTAFSAPIHSDYERVKGITSGTLSKLNYELFMAES